MVRVTKQELRDFRRFSRETGQSVPELLRIGGLERGKRLIAAKQKR